MNKKLKLNTLQVDSFIIKPNSGEIKGGVAQGTLTGTETYYFPCTHGGGCMLPTDPRQCDIQVSGLIC